MFCVLSFISAAILKYWGISFFDEQIYNEIALSHTLYEAINFVIVLLQFYLMVGCVVREQPKALMFKIIPFIPLVLIFFMLSSKYIMPATIVIWLAVSLSIKPKFKTILLLIVNLIIISLMQIALVWIKTNVLDLAGGSEYPVLQYLTMNIDQFIFLVLLYYFNRKAGEINVYSTLFRKG